MMLSLGSSTSGLQVSHGFTAWSQKFAKGAFNCKGEPWGEKKEEKQQFVHSVAQEDSRSGAGVSVLRTLVCLYTPPSVANLLSYWLLYLASAESNSPL